MSFHLRMDDSMVLAWLLLFTTLPLFHCQQQCEGQSYNCGLLTNISYPFWGNNRTQNCGGGDTFYLSCDGAYPTLRMGLQNFRVLEIDTNAHTIRMERADMASDFCSPQNDDIYLDSVHFRYHPSVHNITIFYDCPASANYSSGHMIDMSCGVRTIVYYVGVRNELMRKYPQLQSCRRGLQVPAEASLRLDFDTFVALKGVLDDGFQVDYTVVTQHKAADKLNLLRKIIIGACFAVFGAVAVIIGFYFYWRKKKNSDATSHVPSQGLASDPSLDDSEQGSQFSGVHRFTYSELEEATNHFDSSRELGRGSFGTVYFGKLHDGRSVAVKRLYEHHCQRAEQFVNEVSILAGLVHPNLVSLYGCTSRHNHELLLVFEHVPNGTVADHLHGEGARPETLCWHTRISIAVETASALHYLHVSGIVHRDVKTDNILLDSNFHVKVGDFGLSRLFPTNLSHISTTPYGTPGYVDPEYSESYQLTSKSDVYSFGVVLIELISSLPAVDITRHRDEINLSNMAIKKIHNQTLHELVDSTLGFGSDHKITRTINAVAELAFRCLQSIKDTRPSMEEVMDALKDIQSDGNQNEVGDVSGSVDDIVLDDPLPPLTD